MTAIQPNPGTGFSTLGKLATDGTRSHRSARQAVDSAQQVRIGRHGSRSRIPEPELASRLSIEAGGTGRAPREPLRSAGHPAVPTRSAKSLDFANCSDQFTHRLVPIARTFLDRSHHDLIRLFGDASLGRSLARRADLLVPDVVEGLVDRRPSKRLADGQQFVQADASAEHVGPLVDAAIAVDLLG